MKSRLFMSTLAISAIALVGTLTPHQKAIAKATNFVCGSWQGTPATLAQTANGNVPVILWKSDYFTGSGYDPQTRCQIISEKFQQYYSDGRLKYLTTGRENGMNVICAAKSNNGGCNGTLFTLKPGSDPGKTLQDLLAVRDRAQRPPLRIERAPRLHRHRRIFNRSDDRKPQISRYSGWNRSALN